MRSGAWPRPASARRWRAPEPFRPAVPPRLRRRPRTGARRAPRVLPRRAAVGSGRPVRHAAAGRRARLPPDRDHVAQDRRVLDRAGRRAERDPHARLSRVRRRELCAPGPAPVGRPPAPGAARHADLRAAPAPRRALARRGRGARRRRILRARSVPRAAREPALERDPVRLPARARRDVPGRRARSPSGVRRGGPRVRPGHADAPGRPVRPARRAGLARARAPAAFARPGRRRVHGVRVRVRADARALAPAQPRDVRRGEAFDLGPYNLLVLDVAPAVAQARGADLRRRRTRCSPRRT